MTFENAVLALPQPVNAGYQSGKHALKGEHRWQVECDDDTRIAGSVNLDLACERSHPNAHRWDYGLGFRERNGSESAIWLEVHPATAGEVSTVLRKRSWLVEWLRTEARDLAKLTARRQGVSFYWLATGSGVHIRPGSQHARRLQAVGLDLPRRKIVLT